MVKIVAGISCLDSNYIKLLSLPVIVIWSMAKCASLRVTMPIIPVTVPLLFTIPKVPSAGCKSSILKNLRNSNIPKKVGDELAVLIKMLK